MIRAAIVGLGWWGGTLVDAVAGSDVIRFTAAFTRSRSEKDQAFAATHGLRLFDDFQQMLDSPGIDAIILATPPEGHRDQVVAAANAGKHVFCEKPFMRTRAEAVEAVAAVAKAGVALGIGYNRRFHPSWIDLKRRIAEGELGTILHLECTMTYPNALQASSEVWRSRPDQAPCGGLYPMGVHAVDGFIDLAGDVDHVFCQSLHRVVPSDNDDTTAILFKFKQGMSGYLGTMTATAGSFRLQVFGSKGIAMLGGTTHVVGQSSHQRRAGLFGQYVVQPVQGEVQSLDVPEFDVNRAELEAFARAALGDDAYPISHAEMVHGVATTEAIISSAAAGAIVPVA